MLCRVFNLRKLHWGGVVFLTAKTFAAGLGMWVFLGMLLIVGACIEDDRER